MPTPTAPLLSPYTAPSSSQKSLTLVTSVLGATSNWLILRFLCDALAPPANSGLGDGPLEGRRNIIRTDSKTKVVLVSFLRSWEFWKGEAKRLGLDLARISNEGNFVFIDGLTELFLVEVSSSTSPAGSGLPASQRAPIHHASTRTPTQATARPAASGAQQRSTEPHKLHWTRNGGLRALENDITSSVRKISSNDSGDQADSETILVIDQPDLLLAATGPSMGVGATEMSDFIMGLREHAHSTIITTSADAPLIHNSFATTQQPTPLETEHAALVVGMAHQARMVMQLRGLDTGVAKDVSGVLRISKGGGWVPNSHFGSENRFDEDPEEKELLYFVQADGLVRVFGRGEAS